ncbi:pyridoxal kinase PdxY [Zavarzinia sp. CC-PAN008]|uniref:pyridoxal kinase PdxY n=1 Tax=Zavarzinia sp. CC-PAN008 TaxID=3243332 RepID=UPI003F747060
MVVLSIQSQVVAGHVGNSAAVFALQRLGYEVWALPTVLFSNHPGHGSFTGEAVAVEKLELLLQGLQARGQLAQVTGVLTGYMGTLAHGRFALKALEAVRAANPDAIDLCDPVMGDSDGLYVKEELTGFFASEALPRADVATPNHFEFEILAGEKIDSVAAAIAAAERIRARGPKRLVVTSFRRADAPADVVETLSVEEGGAWLAAAPKLARVPNGSGDLFAALLLGFLLRGTKLPFATERAVGGTWQILEASVARGLDELALIPAQDRLDGPRGEITLSRVV